MLRFQKVTFESLKNWESFRYLSKFILSWVISNTFWIKVKLFRNKNLFSEGIYQKKKKYERDTEMPSPFTK